VELVAPKIESHVKLASFSANIDRLVTSVTKRELLSIADLDVFVFSCPTSLRHSAVG
jgi:hypothetical protein